jgi:hypothetical protein
VIIPNDALWMGIMPMLSRYNSALVENELSLNLASINLRRSFLITAPDDRSKLSAEIFLEQLEEGKPGVIADNEFLGGIATQPYSGPGQGNLTQLLEYEQYLKASLYNEIGLNANFNMKRETIVAGEANLNQDALLPLVDDMLRSRQTACDEINALYGLNLSVSLASSWEDNQLEIDAAEETINDPDPEPEPDPAGGGEGGGTEDPEGVE